MFKQLVFFVFLCMLSSGAIAQCNMSIDYDSAPYNSNANLDGVGMGSGVAERTAAAYSAVGQYRMTHGPYSVPVGSTICIKYDDNSTEKFEQTCLAGTECTQAVPNTHTAPTNWGGAYAGPGWYRYHGSSWLYVVYGCINCVVYYGEVGNPEPVEPKEP